MMEYFVVWPASNGTAPLVKGPFGSVERAAEERQVNGDIVCTFLGTRKVADAITDVDGNVIVNALYAPTYEAVPSKDWLFDWETKENSPFAWRYATQGGRIS